MGSDKKQPILNGPRNLELFQWGESWARRSSGVIGSGWGSASSFVNRYVAMAMMGGEQIPSLRSAGMDTDMIGVTPMPRAPGDSQSRWYVAGEAFTIPTLAKNPEAAWQVAKWMLEPKNATEFAVISGKPPARLVSARTFMATLTEPIYKDLMQISFVAQPVGVAGTPLDSEAGNALLRDAWDRVVKLQESAVVALDRVQALSEAKVREYLEQAGPWW